MVFPPAYHADSDADDEYERSVMTSPHLPTDSETSPTDSEPPSAEHTPTTFGNLEADRSSPRTLITDWTTEECADFVSSLGLPQYCKHFLENEIVGEALIALKHDELKEMGIASVGHRLTILKSVYDTKVKQDVPVDPDHYIPLSAEASLQDQTATQDDIARIIQSIKLRDERIIAAETELRKITEEYRRLREELLPVFRIAKNQSQPLPYQPPGNSPELHNYDQSNVTLPPISHAPQEKSGSSGLFRKPSKKSFFLGSTPKNNSPTHIPQAIPEGRALSENSNLDPSAAAVAASSHLAASVSGGSQPSNSPNQVNVPSPTSPTAYPNTATLSSRPYVRDAGTSNAARTMYPHVEESLPHFSYSSNATTINGDRDRSNPTPTPTSLRRAQQEDPPGSAGREPHSVEIFKSFRVSLEDPCHKVLPAALKKYNINADWRQYSLYIVYGDQERCLGLDERPLILFKQLDREGRKPMFMLRRHAAPIEGHSGPSVGGPGSAGLDSGITHSEWASEDAYSASAGSAVFKSKAAGASFKRLPFNFCAVSLQPFAHPVCTADGTIFDLTNILPWLKRHGTNPVTGLPMKSSELIKLNFAKNDEGEMVDPVTFKVFTDNTHIVALRNTGNVFAWDTVERLNVKAKMWKDLVSDEEFGRKDIITLQDPQHLEGRDLSAFKYLQDNVSTLTEEQESERNDPGRNVNKEVLGSSAKILKAKEAVAKARQQRSKESTTNSLVQGSKLVKTAPNGTQVQSSSAHSGRALPYNAAQHTTGKAAASFTSTGLTPHTSGERALLTDEEYMLRPKRVKVKGYARIQTNLGDLNVELQTEYAPKAVWNFVQLSKKGYYKDVAFHRNIRNFMIQGGDPTGTGKGGTSVWGRNFNDEFDGPLTHDSRGMLSMANKGKNTNSSQFFITYRPAKHLDRKHTIFGRVVGGLEALSRLENAPTDSSDRPTDEVRILNVVVFVDPFEEFQKQKREKDEEEREKQEIIKQGGREDERTTWTGKRIRGDGTVVNDAGAGGVGKYLKAATANEAFPADSLGPDDVVAERDQEARGEPVSKKAKFGGFGNFDNW